uniref:D-alanine--D-alanine ligase n=1 Tax=uncultured gamma proteobacterium HF0500_32L01 TaxID=723574 RepID=E7C5Z5_9GAMM|nr:D-alanine-D-alanine ligase and related ATP-grasp enzymes [uncultured gamma proteobacterium HF0500_32L01]
MAHDGSGVEGGEFDVVFPLLHGPYGEDGTVQGLLELAGVPYVGAGVAASAVGMDKELARTVFSAVGLPQTRSVVIHRSCWRGSPGQVVEEVEREFNYPLFVKPASLGSSVGISKVHDRNQLIEGLNGAGIYDTKILIEVAVEAAREIECAVLGGENPEVSGVGEIVPGAEFYDYRTKYIDDCATLIIPADLPEATVSQIQEMSIRAFRAIDCSGLARVDFLISQDGEIFLNEINTMPGFTPISMYPKLWEEAGLSYPDLIDKLIQLALARHSQRRDLKTTL